MTETKPTPRAARFWTRIARKYAAGPVADQAAYQYKLDRTASYLTPRAQVLEFGCGTGTTALIHAPRVAQIDAVDFSAGMIEIAREKATAEGAENVAFHVCAIEDWPLPKTPYDMVMTHSVLHLVANLDATLARIRGCLAPGGLFVSSTVCVRDMSALLALGLPLVSATGLIPKVVPLKASGLMERIGASGFAIQEHWRPGPRKAVFIVARAI